jgi:hypothetical protein
LISAAPQFLSISTAFVESAVNEIIAKRMNNWRTPRCWQSAVDRGAPLASGDRHGSNG